MKILPNFFPHLYIISRDELPKVKDGKFEEIFVHFNKQKNPSITNEETSEDDDRTIVYKGECGQRLIAIKKILATKLKLEKMELSLILQSDLHPNILRFYGFEHVDIWIYIGMELCECNLATFVQDKKWKQKMAAEMIFQQTAEGLNYLHQLSISEYCSFSSSVSKFNLKFQFMATSNQKIFWLLTIMIYAQSESLILKSRNQIKINILLQKFRKIQIVL